MSDSPAPISYINDENETSNNPSMVEEKQNINNYNDYPENIETSNDNNNTNPKSNSSVPITYRSKFNWFPFPFIFSFSGFGILSSYLLFKDGNIGVGIGVNIFTLIGIGFCFCLKCSSMTIDLNKGVIYVKISKIYYCKKYIYNINNIAVIDIRLSIYDGIRRNGEVVYDIVLILNDGSNVLGASRSDDNNDSNRVYNNLRNILPQHIQIVNTLRQQQPFLDNE